VAKPGTSLKYYPSLSGSETDVSTSTENLTQEERFVLRNMERQEPQGEETHAPAPHYGQYHHQNYLGPAQYQPPPPYNQEARLVHAQQIASNNARREALRLDAMLAASRHGTPAGTPAPIQQRILAEDLYNARMSPAASRIPVSVSATGVGSPYPVSSSSASATISQELSLSRLAPSVYSHPNVQDPILKSPKSFYQDPQVIVPNRGFNISSSGAYFDTSATSVSRPAVSSVDSLQSQNDLIAKLTREMKMNGGLSGGSDVESSGSTSTLNNPSATAEKIAALQLQAKISDIHNVSTGSNISTISGLNKTSQSLDPDTSKLLESQHKDPPPYESPKKDEIKVSKQQEMRKPSLGKPDNLPLLSSLTQSDLSGQIATAVTSNGKELGSPDVPHYTQEMMEIIIGENRDLKHHLDISKRKILKLDNLEKEMMKIHEAYTALKEHSEKRELLEKSARAKLQAEVLSLTEVNKELKERHEAIMAQMMSTDSSNIPGLDTILRGEIMRKDGLINQLVGQNKELMAAKDRQDIELTAQRETIQEHRTHIDVLDSALSNAQTNVLRLEEGKREMTKNLEQLQTASEKRELMEKKLRAKLEIEVKELRQGNEMSHSDNTADNHENFEQLRAQMNNYEEKIIRLESERTQWEQRYLEESAMRQVAIDAASIPKDAKIAVLEKTSAESEKMIAEARSDKLKQSAEMQQTQKKVVDMENQIRSLESELLDRDSIIKILQNRAFDHQQASENVLSIPIQDSSSKILHSKQLSHGPLTSSPSKSHSSQLSTPVPMSAIPSSLRTDMSVASSMTSRHQTPTNVTAAADFFEGISRDMSSTSRGPLHGVGVGAKLSLEATGGGVARSATPSDILRVSTPTRDLIMAAKSNRRDSAPSTVLSESFTGKTLINTSELYTSNGQGNASGTLPKMTFAPMKEELSRTLPTKGFPSMTERFGGDSSSSPSRRLSGQMMSSSPVRNILESGQGQDRKHIRSTSRSRDRSDQSNMSLDSSITLLDNTVNSASGVWNRSSLLEALKQEKETRPESYWRV